MSQDSLKLTIYFGERDRAGGGFLADAFTDVYERHGLQASVLLRGVAGYGAKQHLRSDRQLTLSEDLPVVSVAAVGDRQVSGRGTSPRFSHPGVGYGDVGSASAAAASGEQERGEQDRASHRFRVCVKAEARPL